jgi:glycosyltransferase involved in cell wall biosynthesis
MSALYGIADALVMPTFFGPTNIPVVEAWSLGCPVLSSDIRGVREQVGDAGILVDPTDSHAIADAMYRLATNDALRVELRGRGFERVARYSAIDFASRLCEILETANEMIVTRNGRREES